MKWRWLLAGAAAAEVTATEFSITKGQVSAGE